MYDDLDRPPLRARALDRALSGDGWRVQVLAETDSTNAVVAERARAGEPAGLVVVAESQTAGRGRLDRSWVSPPRAGLTFSVLLRPDPALLAWQSLLGGVAVARAVREVAQVDAVLKWPNDVLVDGKKLCGLLAEVPVSGAVVLGIGLNVTTRADELPHAGATSLQLVGAVTVDREPLLKAVLRHLARPADRGDYRALCSTIGRRVRLELPDGTAVEGVADDVDTGGRLVVGGTAYAAGDVVHLR